MPIKEISGTSVHSSAGTPRGFARSTPPATSARVNTSGGTASPGALIESLSSVFEEDDARDRSSPELGGRADRKLRWLVETPVVLQG